jgi:hypothetical protein
MHAGETVAVRIRAAVGSRTVSTGTVVAEFWSPFRADPEQNPDERDRPDWTTECSWDEPSRSWLTHVATEGWPPGLWTVRGKVATTFGPRPEGQLPAGRGWAWQRFTLAP